MNQELIRQALEAHLAALTPAILILYENTGAAPPASAETPYMQAYFRPAEPDNVIAGQTIFREHGFMQVSLKYPLGKGPGAAAAKAAEIRQHFKRGTTLTKGGLQTMITHTPTISGGMDDAGRWHVPVTIRWQAWVPVA